MGYGVKGQSLPSIVLIPATRNASNGAVDAADVGQHVHAVEPEAVEGPLDLGQRLVQVAQRQAGKGSEPAGMIDDRRCGHIVDVTSGTAQEGSERGRRSVARVDPRKSSPSLTDRPMPTEASVHGDEVACACRQWSMAVGRPSRARAICASE